MKTNAGIAIVPDPQLGFHMGKKKLPTKREIADRYGRKSVHETLMTDPVILPWITDIFTAKKGGEINISFDSIGDELSQFLETRVSGNQVRWAYIKWLNEKL